MLCASNRCPLFTLEQVTSLSTWNILRPTGLGVRIAKDHERFPEVAMLFRHDPEDVRYFMHPTSRGTVVLVRWSDGKWALPTIEAALAKVLELERSNATATQAMMQEAGVATTANHRPVRGRSSIV